MSTDGQFSVEQDGFAVTGSIIVLEDTVELSWDGNELVLPRQHRDLLAAAEAHLRAYVRAIEPDEGSGADA